MFLLLVPHSLPTLRSERRLQVLRSTLFVLTKVPQAFSPCCSKVPGADEESDGGLQTHASPVCFWLYSGLPLRLLTFTFSEDDSLGLEFGKAEYPLSLSTLDTTVSI